VGVEPAPGWAAEARGGQASAGVVVSWLGRPETGFGGSGRPHSQSLFRRTYEYAPDAAGLTGVPIQVWSTKSFTATWERPFQPAGGVPRLRRQDVQVGGMGLTGTLTNPLPVALKDVALVYGEGGTHKFRVYWQGTLAPGQTRPLANEPRNLADWLQANPGAVPGESDLLRSPADNDPLKNLMRRIMFHDADPNQPTARDTALHHLDQSWRRFHPGEAMLIGRVARQEGPAEAVTQDPASASRLWLGRLPAAGEESPKLAGTLVQDTFVRLFLRVEATPR
jgi:hypothetical protein